MTDHLSELREAGKRATPGPWKAEPDTGAGRVWVQRGYERDCEPLFNIRDRRTRWPKKHQSEEMLRKEQYEQREADAALIAFARNNWDALLDVVEALAELSEWSKDYDVETPPQVKARTVLARLNEGSP